MPDLDPVALSGTDLDLAYHGEVVVHGAAVQLRPGEVTALVGPNGSGKSTVLRALARLHPPARGSVRLGDEADVSLLSRRSFARRVTLLAQSRPTPSGVSVADVVQFGRHPYRGRWRATDPDGMSAVAHAMRVTGIEDLAQRCVDELSGGQRQRVWLASCLAQQTDVLLLDEPTTYLDLRYQVEMLDLVRELADVHRVAVGVVLHDLDQAAAVADVLVLMDEGHVRACGDPAEVLTTELLSDTYGIRVEVDTDPVTDTLRTRAVGRQRARAKHPTASL